MVCMVNCSRHRGIFHPDFFTPNAIDENADHCGSTTGLYEDSGCSGDLFREKPLECISMGGILPCMVWNEARII
jgi:hypothetical protein